MITPKQAFAHRPEDWFPHYQNVRVEQVFSPGVRFTKKNLQFPSLLRFHLKPEMGQSGFCVYWPHQNNMIRPDVDDVGTNPSTWGVV